MSEGDLLQAGSPARSSSELQTQSEDELNASLQFGRQDPLGCSPPRSRCQSAGSAHREALLFFERHQLFQSNTDLPNLSGNDEQAGTSRGRRNIIGIDIEPGRHLGVSCVRVGDSTELSSFSKSPSPAHFSDVQSSSTDEDRGKTYHYQYDYSRDQKGHLSVLDSEEPCTSQRARSKSDNLSLFVKKSNIFSSKTSPSDITNTKTFDTAAANTPGQSELTGESSSRNRSIRGRSHSQPSQVLLNTGTTTEGDGGFTTRRKGSKRDKYISWLEQIQFRAQYQHFRTNDYASVVNSVSSLDKTGTPSDSGSSDIKNICTGGTGTNLAHQIGETPHSSHQHHHHHHPQIRDRSGSSGGEIIRGTHSPSLSGTQAHGFSSSKNFCWNFPRVKLRRIFNAKSLDDILGRSRKSSLVNPSSLDEHEHLHQTCFVQDPSSDPGGATTAIGTNIGYLSDSNVLNKKTKNTSLTSLKIHNPLASSATTSKSFVIDQHSGSTSFQTVGEGSYSESCQALPGSLSTSSIDPSRSVSSVQRGVKSDKPKSHSLTSTLTSVLSRVPQFHSSSNTNTSSTNGTHDGKKYRKKGNKKEKPSKSVSSGSLNRVACAKSDTYLNRIVASATCARFNVGKSVDNLNTNNITTHPNISSSIGKIETHKKTSSSSSSCTKTSVKPFSSSNKSASGTSDQSGGSCSVSQPQQRRWTAVKHKWDLKLQTPTDNTGEESNPSGSCGGSTSINNTHHYQQNLLFIKTQLSQVGVPTGENNPEETCQLESLTSTTDNPHQTVPPHEPGRVSFRLEPEEIPPRISPPISRSQSSDFRPTEINPNLLVNTLTEEESEEMTKSRHFHYRDFSAPTTTVGGSGGGAHAGVGSSSSHRRKDPHLLHHHHHEEIFPNKASGMTTKEKAQLVVTNVAYLQRPTSPCLILGDPSASTSFASCSSPTQQQQSQSSHQSSSSPIVFSNNNNYPTDPQIHSQSHSQSHRHHEQQSILSPTSPLSSAQQHARMKQEYLNSGGGGFYTSGVTLTPITNLNEPEHISKNINKSSTTSGTGKGASSFVPCYNRNDVLSPTRGILMPKTGTTTITTGMKSDGAKPNPNSSLYGGGGGYYEEQQEFKDPHHDMTISNNKKDNRSNKNVTLLAGSDAFSSREHSGGCGSGPRRFPSDCDPSQSTTTATDAMTKAGPDFPTQYGYEIHSGQSQHQSQHQSTFSRQIGSPSSSGNQEEAETIKLPPSSQRNNNFQSIESTEDEEEMGDLQSPTYVKRTAHMFNSRYSSQHNGSGSNVSDPIKENRNPSYLNVSKSVSGYSSLSYNNQVASNGSSASATTTTINTNTSNGSPYSQKFINTPPTAKIRSEFTVRVNQPQFRDHRSQYDDDDFDDNVEGSLLKSPIKARYISSSADHAPSSSFDDEGSDSSPVVVDSSYTPSHGKSFIMQRIERLYGSDAVNSASVFSRSSATKSGVTTTTTIRCESSYQSPTRGKEHIIPIQVERDDNNSSSKDQVAKIRQKDEEDHYERCIRGDEMLISSDKDELISPTRRSNNNMKSAKDNFTSRNSKQTSNASTIEGVYEGVSLESCPGKHRLHTISIDDEERKVLMSNSSTFKNGDKSNITPSPVLNRNKSTTEKNHVNGNNGYTNGNSKKDDSGIVIDDKEMQDQETEDLNRYANDSSNLSLNKSFSITESPSKSGNQTTSAFAKHSPRKSPTSAPSTADDSGILDQDEGDQEKASSTLYSYRKSSLSSSGGSSGGGSPEPGVGQGSPSKPKLKPKPKDMALLRTLSHSPTHKGIIADRHLGSISSEPQDKIGAVAIFSVPGVSLEKIIGTSGQDVTDASADLENNRKLSDIRNILKTTSSLDYESCGGESKNLKSTDELKSTPDTSKSENQRDPKDKENDFKELGATSGVKDGKYFLEEMNNTKKQLNMHVEKATLELEKFDEQSEQYGNILAAIGKSNLLTKKKFKQFEELCHANLRGVTGDQPLTTDEDLAGFWDMVMIQVDQVYTLFKDLDGNNQANDGLKPKTPVPRKAVSSSTKVAKPSATKSQISAAAKARDESRRKMLAERRRLMKNQEAGSATTDQEDVVIFTPENN